MSSLLSNTFRPLTIFNAFVNSILSPIKIQCRAVHLNNAMFRSEYRVEKPVGQARKTLEKKLGFVLRPKEPLPPYFRFVETVRPSIKAAHPHFRKAQLYTVFADMWNSLDATEKEKYTNEYKDEMKNYSAILENYNSQLTADQHRKIEETVSARNTKILVNSYKKRACELGKPKKPSSSFLKYFHEQTDRKISEKYKVYMKRISRRWSRLKMSEKENYKATAEELENYKQAMITWEAKITEMIMTEGEDTVRYSRHKDGDDGK